MAYGYSATSLRRRRQPGLVSDDEMAEAAAQGRRYSYGAVEGSRPRSRPGVTVSENESMSNLSGLEDYSGKTPGLARQNQWDSFFTPKKPLPDLTPTTPPAASAMAPIAERGGFFDDPKGFASLSTSFEPPSPTKYLQGAIGDTTSWFDKAGMPIGGAARRVSGDNFKSEYGTGSVMSGEDYGKKYASAEDDYVKKLKRLSQVGSFSSFA